MSILDRFNKMYSDISELNVEDLNTLYHPDVTFVDPVTTHKGLSSVKGYFMNLLKSSKTCTFTIHDTIENNSAISSTHFVVVWTMYLTSEKLNKGNPITLDGTSLLTVEKDLIIYHRDYYDMGQMIYENIPVLRHIILKIKSMLAKS
ncbi:nuclear transport factor 2 family protein [Alteromonas sp. 5E99-2]|uniref:nuclear transport factor 2 family protein n=1 Tax=Alteromonas sp. 5E99-2 TaxID=2817683 RepID=UPI001A991CD5|nr:nuclear transport factor 2 family protein [Alteromonas sp. 5E99-2]MBO1255270.1 nuclear transport factor 2 family protein [Alteromonas sp. 5E99-2]